jgi:hypothetical protein
MQPQAGKFVCSCCCDCCCAHPSPRSCAEAPEALLAHGGLCAWLPHLILDWGYAEGRAQPAHARQLNGTACRKQLEHMHAAETGQLTKQPAHARQLNGTACKERYQWAVYTAEPRLSCKPAGARPYPAPIASSWLSISHKIFSRKAVP